MDTFLKFLAGLAILAAAAGCGGPDELSSRVPSGISGDTGVFDDGQSVARGPFYWNHELVGVDSDGERGVVRLSWALTEQGIEALGPNSRMLFRTVQDGRPGNVLESREVSAVSSFGTIDVPVNTKNDADRVWRLELARVDLDEVPGLVDYSEVNFASILTRKTTPLEQIRSVELSLLEDSYTAKNNGNRREHNFSVSVGGQLAIDVGAANGFSEQTRNVSVTGLVDNDRQPFLIRESGVHDTESPLTVTDVRKDPLVYLVMDASSSMLQGECSDDLYHAVSSTVITLAPSAIFSYRTFDNEVHVVGSTLEFAPSDAQASGSALYYALDTVVADIERWENPDRDIFIIAYSDGLDLASWNHYNFASRNEVVAHVGQRLSGVSQQHQQINGRNLKTFLVGFDPLTGSEAEEMLFLATQGRGEYVQMNRDDCNASLALRNAPTDTVKDKIEDTFLSLTENIRSVYHMNYSSQQTHGRSTLSLQIYLSDSVNHRLDLPARPLD